MARFVLNRVPHIKVARSFGAGESHAPVVSQSFTTEFNIHQYTFPNSNRMKKVLRFCKLRSVAMVGLTYTSPDEVRRNG
jgi:hypothetical protein